MGIEVVSLQAIAVANDEIRIVDGEEFRVVCRLTCGKLERQSSGVQGQINDIRRPYFSVAAPANDSITSFQPRGEFPRGD
jgi:hypothetical protein